MKRHLKHKKEHHSKTSAKRRLTKLLPKLIVLVFIVVFAGLGTHYLHGSHAASCTTTISPGANIETSFDALSSGQTLCLNGGTYNAGAPPEYHFSKAGVTITAAPGATAIVHGWPYVTGDNTTFTGITWILDGGTGSVTNHCGPGGVPNAGFPQYTNGTFQIQANGVTLSHNDISEKGLTQSYRGVGVSVGFGGTVSNVKIFNNRIHDVGDCGEEDHAIYLGYAASPQVYGNWLYDVPAGTGVEFEYAVTNGHVYDNVIDHVSAGFTLSGSTSGNVIDHNVITNVQGNHGIPSSSQGTGCSTGCGVWTFGLSGTNTWSTNDYYPNSGSGMISGGSQTGISNSGGNLGCNPGYTTPFTGNPPQTGSDSGNTPDYRVGTSSCVASWGLWDGDLGAGGSGGGGGGGGGGGTTTTPATPTGLTATAGNASISLHWTANAAGDNVTGYNVYRSDQTFSGPWSTVVTNSFTNSDQVTNGTQYCYQVTAVNSAGESAKTAQACATPSAGTTTTVPSVPTGLIAIAGNASISLHWNANASGDNVTKYNVYRSDQTFSGPWATVTGTTTFTNTDQVTNGTQYCYSISAVNAVGESAQTSQVCATPTGTTAVVGDLNGDGHVTIFDLSTFLTHWGQTGTGITEDFNGDSVVNIFDLSELLANYGK